MAEVRIATIADATELVRLRAVMLASMDGREPDGDEWRQAALATLRSRLGEPEPTMTAFVVDHPEHAGRLAACAVGTVEHRLGGPNNPTGRVGYVFNVSTDPDQRRRGYSRQCVTALLDWFRHQDIRKIDLRATEEAEPLYRSLGFVRTRDPAMRLTS
ncbi:GNAT family N-acetyltransferase [Plantactinospora sp. GCM10030261]|uniref:GNAT family N-acetyltransferase n=1 Tax=Plantactinospora sp. GCM10030261 TaxID=3273420 RepID=UPI003617B17E